MSEYVRLVAAAERGSEVTDFFDAVCIVCVCAQVGGW